MGHLWRPRWEPKKAESILLFYLDFRAAISLSDPTQFQSDSDLKLVLCGPISTTAGN
jgi:hypothetical protein